MHLVHAKCGIYIFQFTSGIATQYMSRSQAVKHLQLTLRDFRSALKILMSKKIHACLLQTFMYNQRYLSPRTEKPEKGE